MSELAFAEAARPRPRRILRVQLLPYSIGHELILIRYRSPLLFLDPEDFSGLDAPLRRMATLQAVSVCSRTWEENTQPERWLRLWGWLIRNEDFDKAADEFRAHRNEGSTCPSILPPENGDDEYARAPGSPLMCRLLDYAANALGPGVFNQPLGMVQWMYFAHKEHEGALRVENDFECQIREEIEQHRRDYAREQEEAKRASA